MHRSIVPYLDRAMRVTDDVGAPIMVVHMPKARDSARGVGREFVDCMVSERKNLNGSGPKITLENRPKFRAKDADLILTTPQELRGFADAHDFPMTLDTAHIGTFDLDLIDSFDCFRGRLANVHLSDLSDVSPRVEALPVLHSYVKQHQLPGAGRLPLRGFIAMLAREAYDGPMTFELSPTALHIWNPRTVEVKLKESVGFVRASMKLD